MSEQSLFASAENAEVQKTTSASEDPAILGVPFSGEAIETILAAFQAREARLLDREGELQELESILTQSEMRIESKIIELTSIEEMLASTLALADTAAEDDLMRLATVYENMKPKDTAALFSEMAPGFAAGFLGLMQAEAAAAVMTELEPQIAHTISVMLAGRNANAFNPE
jgi:flagellar motility protein MotE (MotC chaperone)